MFKPVDSNHKIARELAKAEEVSQLARRLMDEYGLQDWTFEISSTKTFLGYCYYHKKRIEFSQYYLVADDEQIEDTIRHEIAHAISFLRYGEQGKGHGLLWKNTARELGADPYSRTEGPVPNTAKPNYVMRCPECGQEWFRFRMKKRNFGSKCPDCKVEVKIYRITRR